MSDGINMQHSKIVKAQIEDRFAHHPPANETIIKAHNSTRRQIKTLAAGLVLLLPECRETNSMLAKLEEVMFHANAAIARNHYYFKE